MTTHELGKKPLDLTKRTKRKLPALQAYTRIYYYKRLKELIDPLWEDYAAKNPELAQKKGQDLRYRNAAIKDFYKGETNEVKVEVDKRREDGDFSDNEDIELDDDDIEAAEWQRRSRALAYQKKVFLYFF